MALMPSLTVGMAMGSTAPALEFYSGEDTSPLEGGPLTEEESSWFGAKHLGE